MDYVRQSEKYASDRHTECLAERMSELSHNDFVKLKAVMDSERIREIPDALACMEHLPEYEWDRSVRDCSAFGRAYLAKNLPTI